MPKSRTRGNGQGTAFKRGTAWTAQITVNVEKDADGKITKRHYKTKGGFKTKRDALAYIEALRNPIIAVDPQISFAQLYSMWAEQHYPKIGRDAVNGYKAAYAKCGMLYYRTFVKLKTADLQKVLDNAKSLKGGELSARAKKDIKSLYCNLYKYALQNDYCEKDYSAFVTCPKRGKSTKDAFTAEEIEKLWTLYNDGNTFVGYMLIMIYTGMRYGEISTIKLENIHLDEKYLVGGIKTEAGIDRIIPLSDKLIPIVEKIIVGKKKKLLEIHEKVFYNDFHRATAEAGIRELSPHCCRHTFFTMMAERGIQPAIITEVGGHTDYQTTMGYTHIPLQSKLDAVNKL